MPFVADFHIHSKYSRATSKDMNLENLTRWAKIKGISMLGTGDFTHPVWLSELKNRLEEAEHGTYIYDGIYFMLTAEVSNIYFKAGRTRKVHNILFAPDFKAIDEINSYLSEYGILTSDGRPILDLECDKMVRDLTRIDPEIFFIPAHAWTPHFSVFGSNSGFDSPEECFEQETPKIFSIETGLSSDPAMNRRWSKLDRFCLISNSDSHSPSKIGRESNVFSKKIGYSELVDILKSKDKSKFLYTIEFFPEEGKYYWNGHRACKTALSPAESRKLNNACPVCGRKITVGVMDRVEALADRPEAFVDDSSPGFKSAVPLVEIIAGALKVGPGSVKVEREYLKIIKNFGNEFSILIEADEKFLKTNLPERVAEGIMNVRKRRVDVAPGYDGEYGKVTVFKEGEEAPEKQLSFL